MLAFFFKIKKSFNGQLAIVPSDLKSQKNTPQSIGGKTRRAGAGKGIQDNVAGVTAHPHYPFNDAQGKLRRMRRSFLR